MAPWYNKEIGPGMEIDFKKGKANVLAMNKFISAQVIGAADGTSTVPRKVPTEDEEEKDGVVKKFADWVCDAYKQISAAEAMEKLSTDPAVLLPDETVDLAFQADTSLVVFTSQRYLKIDTRGFGGQLKVRYKSIPYKSTASFSVTGEEWHPFDWYCEMRMIADIGYWGLDVKKEQGDISQAYNIVNKRVVLDKLGK